MAWTYPPPDVREGLWFRWPVIGQVVYAGLLATGEDHVPGLEFWNRQHGRGPGSRLIFHPPKLGGRWGTLSLWWGWYLLAVWVRQARSETLLPTPTTSSPHHSMAGWGRGLEMVGPGRMVDAWTRPGPREGPHTGLPCCGARGGPFLSSVALSVKWLSLPASAAGTNAGNARPAPGLASCSAVLPHQFSRSVVSDSLLPRGL